MLVHISIYIFGCIHAGTYSLRRIYKRVCILAETAGCIYVSVSEIWLHMEYMCEIQAWMVMRVVVVGFLHLRPGLPFLRGTCFPFERGVLLYVAPHKER